MRIHCRPGLVFFVVVVLPVGVSAQEDPHQLVKRILADWQQRQESLQSLGVEISGTQFWPKGLWDNDYSYRTAPGKETLARLGHIPPEDVRHSVKVKFVLHLDNNWARRERRGMVILHPEATFVPQHRTHLFDGEQIRVFTPRESNTSSAYTPSKEQPDLWIQGRSFAPAFSGNEDNPVFWGCGIVWVRATQLNKLKFPIDERNYLFEGFGEIDGRRQLVLRSPNLQAGNEVRYEFWVDPERGSTISRSRFIQDGKLRFQIDAEWGQLDRRWFPTRWTYKSNTPGRGTETLETSFDLKVDRVVFNPPVERSDFDVKLRPNMVVYDAKTNAKGVIGADSRSLLPLSASDEVRRELMWRRVAIWICAAAGAIALMWALRRRWPSRNRE